MAISSLTEHNAHILPSVCSSRIRPGGGVPRASCPHSMRTCSNHSPVYRGTCTSRWTLSGPRCPNRGRGATRRAGPAHRAAGRQEQGQNTRAPHHNRSARRGVPRLIYRGPRLFSAARHERMGSSGRRTSQPPGIRWRSPPTREVRPRLVGPLWRITCARPGRFRAFGSWRAAAVSLLAPSCGLAPTI
jgi:hypothetical protein